MAADPETPGGSVLGHPVRRREDPRLITGAGKFVDDVEVGPDHLFACFVRATMAHARIISIDLKEASKALGVSGAFAADSFGLAPRKSHFGLPDAFDRPPLATGVVRFVGEPVAVVVAESRAEAVDAADLVSVEYEPLIPVVDAIHALRPEAPVIFPKARTNVCHHIELGLPDEDALEGAEVRLALEFHNQRVAAVPMEPNGVVAVPAHDGTELTVWASCQSTIAVRDSIAASLGMAPERIRVVAPDVGGGFGAKMSLYPEQVVVAALALRTNRPVRWAETRSENLVNMVHGRAQIQWLELAATNDGHIIGLSVNAVQDAGAYPAIGAWLPTLTGTMLSGVYRIPHIRFVCDSVVTNTTPVASYRGAGRPEAAALLERAMDILAARVGVDPVEIRRRNYLHPTEFPLVTVVGGHYDSGDYGAALDRLLEMAGYENLRKRQQRRRNADDPILLGIGLSSYVEMTGGGGPREYGGIRIFPDGRVKVAAGTVANGQGHETTYAQLVSALLNVPMQAIEVIQADTMQVPYGYGTVGSRSMQMGGVAVHMATLKVIQQGREALSEQLEVDPADIEVVPGGLQVRGTPGSRVGWAQVAEAVGVDGLKAETDFDLPGRTYPFGAHLAVVEVDSETGQVRLIRHVAVDDCGRILNPRLVEGQQHGGIAQGVAQALFEEVIYDGQGTPQSASLLDYIVPTANELPILEAGRTITPTPLNPLGVKGIGESGTIGAGPAVHNAVLDALAPYGIIHLDMPLTPEKVWTSIHKGIKRVS